MDRLIGVVKKLQDVVVMIGSDSFHLPQIVVVGDQSSGKSSVLENLVGKSFLPRGVGAVTRRPLLIHLEAPPERPAGGDDKVDHVVFQHVKNRTFTDFRDVMMEIEEETERVAGSNKGICDEPISMTIYSKKAASSLTLVDLPGIVKVPMGDQPPDIEDLIHNLILKYISNPNAIILAVVTANTDIATSESLKVAREVDPNGERTLAVITKLDLMDPGTDATDILMGNVISVHLGVIGVVNRSQRDIMQGKSINESAIEETNFFQYKYPQIANRNGTAYLANRLQRLLIRYIKDCLPQLRQKILESQSSYAKMLHSLEGPTSLSPIDYLLVLLTEFGTNFCSKIQGPSNELETEQLVGGARIHYIFQEIFCSTLKSIDPVAEYSRGAILTAMRNAAGAKPCIFIPETCFEFFIRKQISKLEAPSLRCVQLVYEELEKILYSCGQDLSRYPKLHQRAVEVISQLLKSKVPETKTLVHNLISIHKAYINTAHPDFKRIECPAETDCRPDDTNLIASGSESSNTLVVKNDVPLKQKGCGPFESIIVEKLVQSYFAIVCKAVQDAVPKAIMYCLVNSAMKQALPELVKHLYKTESAESLLQESKEASDQRIHAAQMLESLKKASEIILEINEGNSLS